MLKKMSLRMKMLLGILPIVAIALILITYISVTKFSDAFQSLTTDKAFQTLEANSNSVNVTLETLRCTAEVLSNNVGTSYSYTDLDSYEKIFSDVIAGNDVISGAGIWFARGVYQNQEYAGPYWYKDGSTIVYTDEYSNADYDYFSQEYYTDAVSMTSLDATITDPYYDETSGTIMATCSAPIFNDAGECIGCITVDTILSSIQDMVSTMSLGETSDPILLSSTGTYLYDIDTSKASSSLNIADDPTMAAAAGPVFSGDMGVGGFETDKGSYIYFYDTIPEVEWKLILTLAQTELDATMIEIRNLLMTICAVSVVVCALIILLLVNSIAKSVGNVKTFAGKLANGDFTIDKMRIKSGDELGQMSDSLNLMYENNKGVITQVSNESEKIDEASSTLESMASQLTNEFQTIQSNMTGVNDAMMSASAATEEVNASVEEVNASVQLLASQADESKGQAEEIKQRAKDIEESSRIAYDHAIQIAQERESDIEAANSQADVVQQIGSLADSIAEIADQINLLSLNASIEAARAGEHGKGFAVVATEINKLAGDTGAAVGEIQDTVAGVQQAFSNLLAATNELLTFLKDTVTPDYDKFVNVAQQYGQDAESFGQTSNSIAEMVGTIHGAMGEVSSAIQNITESTQDTATRSSEITDTVNIVSDVVGNVSDMSSKQSVIAKNLAGVVAKFKLH